MTATTCMLCRDPAASAPESSRTGSGGASGTAKGGWFGRAREKVKRWKNRTPVQHEANKAAQKRYRERKKGQVTELQAQAEQLAAQVTPVSHSPACAPPAGSCPPAPHPPPVVPWRGRNAAGAGCCVSCWQRASLPGRGVLQRSDELRLAEQAQLRAALCCFSAGSEHEGARIRGGMRRVMY